MVFRRSFLLCSLELVTRLYVLPNLGQAKIFVTVVTPQLKHNVDVFHVPEEFDVTVNSFLEILHVFCCSF